ncbi:MAG: ABC transporter substrate-binding protein [Bacteroidetes bacterium]|nr:ABC transporter substrate-binding protein [Bacteroidota bacterium]
MRKSISFILSLGVFFTSCSNPKEVSETKAAKGNRTYGGTLRLNENDTYATLYPPSITDVISSHIANQIYEGLIKLNPKDLTVIPSLAEKWEVNSAGTVYTFHLKKGVLFHDNACFPEGKGRELKAADVAYSYKVLCTDSKENVIFAGTFKNRLAGADKFFAESKSKPDAEIEGIKVIDDYTIELSLIAPSLSFIYALAQPVFAKEAIEKYGTDIKVGTGPFIFVENEDLEHVVLKRNDKYHGVDSLGNQLPFLDSIVFSSLPTKKLELESFQNGDLSLILGLPSESIKDMVENQIADFQNKPPKYVLERSPEMISQYYIFNLGKEPFNNVKVRRAFSYAIDRNKIVENVLKGEAYGPGVNGVSPPSFQKYDITKITGYNFDPEKAKKLLAEAGYPNGKGFPKVKIELNSGGSKHTNVVLEIQKQLMDVLNVNVDFEVVPMAQKLNDEKYARSEISRAAWVADFPSPENFLYLFYGESVPTTLDQPSFPNSSRYKNPEFDKLFKAGLAAKTQEESYANFMKAEQLAMDDAPLMILWYDENYRLIKSSVHNFFSNPMRYKDYSQVYLKTVDAPLTGPEATEEKK